MNFLKENNAKLVQNSCVTLSMIKMFEARLKIKNFLRVKFRTFKWIVIGSPKIVKK